MAGGLEFVPSTGHAELGYDADVARAARPRPRHGPKRVLGRAGACTRPSCCPAPRTRRTPSGRRLASITGCDCCFEVIEESLNYPVVKRLDPLAPDRLVFPAAQPSSVWRTTVAPSVRSSPNQFSACNSGGLTTRNARARARAIELFPQHQPGVGQAVPLRLRSRSDLRRPDPVEVGDECSDPRRWCRDNPFVKFPDFHPPLTSHPRQAGGAGRLRRREPTPRPGGPPGP